jgi:nucleoside-diphosphate-sugar epimerase
VRTSGLPAVIVRPGQIFGPGAERVAPSGTIGLAGRWTVVGSGNALLPLVYVDDVVSALLLAAEKPGVEGHLFHLVDAELVTQRDYVEAARRYLGKGLTVFYMPSSLMMALAICVETLGRILGRGVPLNRYRVRSIRPLSVCDCRAAIEKLGWKPPVGTREGLRRTFVDRGRGATRSAAPSPQG